MTDREAILIMKNKRNKLEDGYTDCLAEHEAIKTWNRRAENGKS